MWIAPGSVVTYCRKPVMVTAGGYEPRSGADVTHFLLDVLCLTSQMV